MAYAVEESVRRASPATTNAPGGAVVGDALTKPFYRRMLEKFVSSAPTKEAMDHPDRNGTATLRTIVPASAVGGHAAQLDPAEIAKIQRDAIDNSYFAELERKAERAIKDPNRKLKWRPSIVPNDEEWIIQRETFRELVASNSIGAILESEFEATQKSLLVPALVDGPLLEVQLQNAKQYKDLFKPGARFYGTADNMLTKLSMLKFGLPIEPLTESNLNWCDNPVDEDDPPDGPDPVPPVERIFFSEKPLEFLDSYNERSFGYPMMRLPKKDYLAPSTTGLENVAVGGVVPNSTLPAPEVPKSAANLTYNQQQHSFRPIFPKSSAVSMRGGAGSPLGQLVDPPRYVYGKNGEKAKVDRDSCEAFKRALFVLFPKEGFIGKTNEWFFHVDVYDNRRPNTINKPYSRTVHIDRQNIEQKWTGTIRHLIFNYEGDWILRVQTCRGTDDQAHPTFALPVTGGPAQQQNFKPPSFASSSKEDGAGQKNTGGFGSSSKYPGKFGWRTKNMGSGTPGNNDLKINVCRKFINFGTDTGGEIFRSPVETGSDKLPEAEIANGIIYGYHGKLEASNTKESFLRAALLLTGQYPADATKPNWTFDVDIPSKTSAQRQSITIIPRNWSNLFYKAILPLLTADEPWQVFVRYGGSAPTVLEPPELLRDVIQLNLEGYGTAYWKIPSDQNSLEDYGINQIQPGFVHAVRLLYPEEPRSKDKLLVSSFNMGVDGLECVDHKFWDLVKDDLANHKSALKYEITFRPLLVSKKSTNRTTIRMVGNKYTPAAAHGDWTALATEIHGTSEACLVDRTLPTSFRIWQSGPARERKEKSAVIKYASIEEISYGLKAYFGEWPESHTVWFRPEWETFELHDIESSGTSTQWESRTDQSLKSFKRALGRLWKEEDSFQPVCITEVPSTNERNIRFIITGDTTEEEWRLYVFDWLHSKRLAVKRMVNFDYGEKPCNAFEVPSLTCTVLDKTSPWGLLAPMREAKHVAFSIPSPEARATSTFIHDDEPDPLSEDFVSRAIQPKRVVAPRVPEFNKTRILKPTAGRAKAQNYATWIANQQELDDLQLQSYTKDQPVVIPGKLPAAPIYGPSRQLQIKVSPNFPTVYVNRLTPSDIDELAEENQTLRNKALERMWACPICDVSFKGYKITNIREHVQEHIKQIQEAGDCPMCGSTNWAFMSMDERREHFAWHMAKEQAAARQEAWLQFQCPACDIDLSKMLPEAIVKHCLKHDSNIVKYCDKCGLHEAVCTEAELIHHKHVCFKAPERKTSDPEPIFCESCGKDTSTHTQTQNILHTRDCQNAPTVSSQTFCRTCGLDVSALNNVQITGHNSRCTVPGGIKGKFCARCATDLSQLDTADKSRHSRTCRPNTLSSPPPETDHSSAGLGTAHCQPNVQLATTTPIQFGSKRPKSVNIDVDALGHCPIAGCNQIIGTLSRQEMFAHFQCHSMPDTQAPVTSKGTFKCPLYDFKGEICNQELSLSDLRFHYGHKGTIKQQMAVQMAGQGSKIHNITEKEPVHPPPAPETTSESKSDTVNNILAIKKAGKRLYVRKPVEETTSAKETPRNSNEISSEKTTGTKKHMLDEKESEKEGQITEIGEQGKSTSRTPPQKKQKKKA